MRESRSLECDNLKTSKETSLDRICGYFNFYQTDHENVEKRLKDEVDPYMQ